MALNKLHWISAAESCQLWDDTFESEHNFPRVRGNIVDAAWSLNNRNLAYIEKDSNEITVATLSGKVYYDSTTISEGDPTALGFSNESLLVGTNLGSVLLWDHLKHKLIRKYAGTDRSSVSRVQSNNSIIAAGHSGGNIFIYGTKTSQTVAHYSIPNSMGLRDMKMSTVKPSLLAAAFNSGTVAAWNTVSKTSSVPSVEFPNVHQSPATCIALSPVTEILMVSGGLDKNFILYDCPKKKVLKKIEADAPITAIEFFPDGTCLLVGTNKGKVLVYDLRSISTPVQSLAAHSSAVSKLMCRWRASDQLKREGGNHLKISSEPVARTPRKEEEPNRNVSKGASSVTSELQCSYVCADTHSRFSHQTEESANVTKDTEHKNSSLFSPLKGECSETFSSPSLATSPVLSLFKVAQYHQQAQETLASENGIEKEDDENEIEIEIEQRHDSQLNSPARSKEELQTEEPEEKVSSSTDFQAEFIRRIVHDVEDNLKEVLRCRFGDLIIQSAQQFLTLQNEMEQLKQQVRDKAYLEEEVRRLRSEVNELRNLY